jgi:hypothetical protein
MASNTTDSSAFMFSGFCPCWLAFTSQLDLALLCSVLQQWGLLRLPHLCQGWLPAMTSDGSVSQLLTADSWPFTDCLVFRFSKYSLCMDPQRTPLPTVPLLLCAYLLLRERGTDYMEDSGLCGVTVLFPSHGCLCWLCNPGFQQICHNIYGGHMYVRGRP